MKEELKRKLTSRKFWAAVLAALAALACALFGDRLAADALSALGCVTNAMVAYIFGESAVDLTRILAEAFGHKEQAAE